MRKTLLGLVLLALTLPQLSVQAIEYYTFTLEVGKTSAIKGKSYLFGVPYTANMTDLECTTDEGAIFDERVSIYVFDGSRRANGQDPWVKLEYDADLYAGKCYKMVLDNCTGNTWKVGHTFTPTETKRLTLTTNTSSSALNSGWNGMANPRWSLATTSFNAVTYAYAYRNKEAVYELVKLSSRTWDVGEPFILQTSVGSSMSFSEDGTGFDFGGTMGGGDIFDAPQRGQTEADNVFSLQSVSGGYTDKAYLTLVESRKSSYIIGQDLEKLHGDGTGVPQLWLRAYDADLAVHTAATMNGEVSIPMYIYVPADGSYALQVAGADAAKFQLLLNGTTVSKNITYWTLHLTQGEHVLTLKVGNSVPTDIQTPTITSTATKFVRNGQLYILKDGQIYNALGGKAE